MELRRRRSTTTGRSLRKEVEFRVVLENQGAASIAPPSLDWRAACATHPPGDELARFRVDLAKFDPGPEGAEGEVGAPVRRIDAERVDGVEIVAIFRHQDEALILPPLAGLERIEGRIGHEPDGARVMPEARQAIVEEDRLSAPADRGRPDIGRREAECRASPRRRTLADHAGVGPPKPIGRGLDPDRAVRGPLLSGAKSDILAVNLDNGRIVDGRVAGHLGLRLSRHERPGCEERERQPEYPDRSFPPNWSHGSSSWALANAGEPLSTRTSALLRCANSPRRYRGDPNAYARVSGRGRRGVDPEARGHSA